MNADSFKAALFDDEILNSYFYKTNRLRSVVYIPKRGCTIYYRPSGAVVDAIRITHWENDGVITLIGSVLENDNFYIEDFSFDLTFLKQLEIQPPEF